MKIIKNMHGICEFSHRGISLIATAIVIVSFSFAITSEGSNTSPSIKEKDLVWTVETEFGGFSVNVSADIDRITYLSLWLERYRCGGITITGDVHAESRHIWPIVNNQFEIDTNLGIYQIIICGVFDDTRTELCGTWQIHSAGTICSGEWKSDLKQ